MLPDLIDAFGATDPLTYLAVFLGASLLMLWRLEAMLDHGLEGTALGTLVMPFCSGLGNLLFVFIMVRRGGPASAVLTNSLVNNVTNLTLLLGLPALCWTLLVVPAGKAAVKSEGKKSGAAKSASAPQINRLSLVLTLTAVVFFTGATWLLGRDGALSRTDGAVLIGLFGFWQCFQVYDVMKHNLTRRASFGFGFYADLVLVAAGAWLIYESLDWLVAWLGQQKSGFVSAANLGWLSGWLMVLPNALLAVFWGWKGRADVVYSSQVGDGHICIPFGVGLLALLHPVKVGAVFQDGLLLLAGAAGLHAVFLLTAGGLPRWAGALFVAAYAWFLWDGLLG
ncbi:MAG: sodium:calcium symporter [Opitutae bacterium]|nr:sodium:calcium symporter [Opitutae bacterium]